MKIYDVLAKRQLKKQSFESSIRQRAGEYFTFRRLKPFSIVFEQKLIYWLNWIIGLDVECSTDSTDVVGDTWSLSVSPCGYGGRQTY